jgi:hypothetical protein
LALLSLSREASIGLGVTVMAIVAMVGDHLLGDDPGLEDPGAFVASAGISVAAAGLLFGWIVPRSIDSPARAARRGLACGIVALFTLPLIFLGLPFVVAGAAVALGLIGLRSDRRYAAATGLVLGGAVLTLAVTAAGIETIPKLG